MSKKVGILIGVALFVIVSGIGAYFALGNFVRTEFKETALKTIDVVEQDIRFAASAAPMVCVINKYKSKLKIDSLESTRRSLDVVLSRAIPETKSIIAQIQPFDSMTKKLHSKTKNLVSNSQSTFETIDERLSDLRNSNGFWETLFSVTITAAMVEEIQKDFQDIKLQVDELEEQGERYKKAALAKLSQGEPVDEMALTIAGHYIKPADKEAVSNNLIARINAITGSNKLFRKYDKEGCFDDYKPQIYRKVRDAVYSAI